MVYSILSEARVRGSLADQQSGNVAYQQVWLNDGDLEGWETYSELDIVGAWGGFVYATKLSSSGGYIGPTDDFLAVDALVNDRITFRMKYDQHPRNRAATNLGKIQWLTQNDAVFDDTKSETFEVISDGRWILYDVNVGANQQWVGDVVNVRIFPCINGWRNDEVFINFFEIGTADFDFSFENEDAGTTGKSTGSEVLSGELTIEQGVNDRLIVNINSYGDVTITLTPQTVLPELIARDISLQLGKIALGGYLRAEAFIDDATGLMVIESGIRKAGSSVEVKFGDNSAAPTLGFTTPGGTSTATQVGGTAPSGSYVPLSAYRPTTLELLSMFDNDEALPSFSLDPQQPVIQGGRPDFALTNRKLKTEFIVEGREESYVDSTTTVFGTDNFQAKTIIDLTHPFSDDGMLESIFVNGVLDTGGDSKWKIFRPQFDGSLEFVDEGVIGKTNISENPDGGLVITNEPGVYTVDVSGQTVFVERGDFLGIYNASLHVGSLGPSKPDAIFYEISGDITTTVTNPPTPSGAGEKGLPLYATGGGTKNRAVIDVDLKRRLNLDKITFIGEEDTRDLEYNVAVAQNAQFGADTPSSHTLCWTYQFTPIDLRTCDDRANTAFNLQALNDNIVLADNGVSSFGSIANGTWTHLGSSKGGATVEGATYFYVNGDAEFLGVHELAGRFPERFGFFRDPISIECYFSQNTPRTDKAVGKVVIYFKDPKNQRAWQLETATSRGGGNGSKSGFQIIPAETITSVRIDEKEIIKIPVWLTHKTTDIANILLQNPVILDVFAADGTRNPQQGVDFETSVDELGGVGNLEEQAVYAEFQWTRFEWNFDAIRTTALRWYNDYHFSTKISEFQIFAVAESNESLGDNVQVLFSNDGSTFATADLIEFSEGDATFKLGNSPQYMRFIIRPTLNLSINEVSIQFEEDQVSFGEEGRLEGALTIDDARIGQTGEPTELLVTNDTGLTADLILDIPPDIRTARHLSYFSPLHSAEDITNPTVGAPGKIDFTSDKVLQEEENIAFNARAYGLKNLAGESEPTVTPNLLTNPGFETGSFEPWDFTWVTSGTGVFGGFVDGWNVPVVSGHENTPLTTLPIDESAPPGGINFLGSSAGGSGDYFFGFILNETIVAQTVSGTPYDQNLRFYFGQTIDVSQYASQIDAGGVTAQLGGTHHRNGSGSANQLHFYADPTEAGIRDSVNHTFDTPSNFWVVTTADDRVFATFNMESYVPAGTRFIRYEYQNNTTGYGGAFENQSFAFDDAYMNLVLPNRNSARWYKSWRTGLPVPSGSSDPPHNGWTDSSFELVDTFVALSGSSHWWQPWDAGAVDGVQEPGQTQGFTQAFGPNRFGAVQSFERMTTVNPGRLSMQWVGEKTIAGFKMLPYHKGSVFIFNQGTWPRKWQVSVLKPRGEWASPAAPDLSDTSNDFRVIRQFSLGTPGDPSLPEPYPATGPWVDAPAAIDITDLGVEGVPNGRIQTWLFDEPVVTEGMRVDFIVNCDHYERAAHASAVAFRQYTTAVGADIAGKVPWNNDPRDADVNLNLSGCPQDNQSIGSDFVSRYGIVVSYFTALEIVDNHALLLSNEVESQNYSPWNDIREYALPNVYAAVDLGRCYHIDTNSDLFELVADTRDQTTWDAGNVTFSADDVDNPNEVVWDGDASRARWIRFSSASTDDFEAFVQTYEGNINVIATTVDFLPQSIIRAARIYPSITTSYLSGVGLNSEWEDLGSILTDNRNDTFIYYSDYPVIAMDFGKPYIIEGTSTASQPNHPFIRGNPSGSADKNYWVFTNETNFAYATDTARATSQPEKVRFSSYGAGVPSFPVRWAAFKGAEPLLNNGETSDPKAYNERTNGQVLFNAAFRPESTQLWTENASWFSVEQGTLRDISTFEFTLGNPVSVSETVDFGASANDGVSTSGISNYGTPYNMFDGIDALLDGSSAIDDGIWGITVRDDATNTVTVTSKNFPHYLWRVFRDPYRGEILTKAVKAIKVLGFGEQYYPTNFRFQELTAGADPNVTSSWSTISNATFTGEDTWNAGAGWTHIFPTAVSTQGIRLRVDSSVYASDLTGTIPDRPGNAQVSQDPSSSITFDTSGPQTRMNEMVIYEEIISAPVLSGTLDNNHSLASTFSILGNSVSGYGPELMKDGRISTYWQSTGFTETITISLPSPAPISRLEWEKDPLLAQQSNRSMNCPEDFELRATVGGVDVLALTETGYLGTSFTGTLSPAVISDEFRFVVQRVQGLEENASSIQISELRLIEEVPQVEPLVEMTDIYDRRPGGTNYTSTKITYALNADTPVTVSLDGIDGNNDEFFSERDFFNLWVKVNDVALLDTGFGQIRLGNSNSIYYGWNISSMNLQSGWNELKLQFSQADEKSNIPFRPGDQFDINTGSSQVDFITADLAISSSTDGVTSHRIEQSPGIRYWSMEFRGIKSSTTNLELTVDDFNFVRNRFDDVCKFDSSLYLNNSELFTIYLNGVDLAAGTVEFWFKPDWGIGARIRRGEVILPALFRILKPDGKFLSWFYRANQGFICSIFDGEQLLQAVSNVVSYEFEAGELMHLALSWSASGGIGPENTSIAMFKNGEPIYGTNKTWAGQREGGNTVLIGGEMGQLLAASPQNATALTFTPFAIFPTNLTASTWGVMENLKIYNYAKRYFEDMNEPNLRVENAITPADMIEISLTASGNDFHGLGSNSLPLVAKGIPSGEPVSVYVRTDIPRGLDPETERDASLLVRWKTPLEECD
jgi:hypothetical protein